MLLEQVADVADGVVVDREGAFGRAEREPQRRIRQIAVHFDAAIAGGQRVALDGDPIDRSIVRPESDERPERQAQCVAALEEPVGDVDAVLSIRHHQRPLHHDAAEGIAPDGQSRLEPELHQMLRAFGLRQTTVESVRAQPLAGAIGEAQPFGEVIEKHHPPERSGQRGNQQPVIAARDGADDRPRRVAAEPVGDEPLAPSELGRVAVVIGLPADAPGERDAPVCAVLPSAMRQRGIVQ